LFKGRLEHRPLPGERLEPLQHLVPRDLLHQDEQGGGAGFEALGQLLHHLVADADVGEAAGQGPARGAGRRADQRIEEQEPDQHPPEAATDGAGGGEVDRLMQLGLALGVLGDDDRVLHLDEVLLLHLHQFRPHLEGGCLVAENDRHKIAHLLPSTPS
jgi:hypothetical protein